MPKSIKQSAEPQIKIPKALPEGISTIPEGAIGEIQNKVKTLDQVVYGIIFLVVLSLAAIIVSVIGLFLDQMRFNNVYYREYSEKINTLEMLKKTNSELLKQNEDNQELIINQQKQILDFINQN